MPASALRERVLVDVGRVEQRALLEPFLAEQDDEGIELLAAAAAGDPDLERRIGAQVRHHLLADRPEIGRVAEHLADLHGQVAQQRGEHARDRAAGFPAARRSVAKPQLLARLLQAPLDRGHGVVAEIVVVSPIQRFQQQLDFDVFDFLRHRNVSHRGIQTRTSESSFSTSSGFAISRWRRRRCSAADRPAWPSPSA